MSWQPLTRALNQPVPKLALLARAQRKGFRVPATHWCSANHPPERLPAELPGPWILRSGSPHEDGLDSSRAGAFESVVVRTAEAYPSAFEKVAASLTQEGQPAPQGLVFVQSFLEPEFGGVAFFDGFHFERTESRGGNQALTAGLERGDVMRGHLQRGDTFSTFLQRLHRAFSASVGAAIDIEYLRSGDEYTLLQVRPALFEVRRNPTLSLANHKEILGDPPSPWIVSVLDLAGQRAMEFFGAVDPTVRTWDQSYCQVAAGRAWIDFASFFRLMDHWGLPRTFVTASIGGEGAEDSGGATSHPADEKLIWGNFLRSTPRLVALQVRNLWTVLRSGATIRKASRSLGGASSLPELFEVGVHLMDVILRVNFAINGALAGIMQVRSFLRIRGSARIVTRSMMEGYETLRRLQADEREAAFQCWLKDYGHRGPLESDPWKPRFRELEDLLRQDLEQNPALDNPETASRSLPRWTRPFYWLDERRESFRDDLMRVWADWRELLLTEADRLVAGGWLDQRDDLFFLTGDDLQSLDSLLTQAQLQRSLHHRHALLSLPGTASLERIEALANEGPPDAWEASGLETSDPHLFPGIALTRHSFEGVVTKARDLPTLLRAVQAGTARLNKETVLVVPALEPSWAVVFGRVGAVVAEIGGELSHASILLREVDKPALVGATGCYSVLQDGETVRLDASRNMLVRSIHEDLRQGAGTDE